MVARCAGSSKLAISEINEHRRELAGRLGFRTYSPAAERFREQFRERPRRGGLVSTHKLADCAALLAELTGGASRLLKPVIVMSL